ncbi:hypothetical protein [Actinomadura rubrisoli]|uniref:Uncharacterized protein n=1 Tax=Actinomadura rubrisoli TaxID=2530368 RepID=A0A4R5BEE7_9ACTN|nr:hypothetical protein [Actinomadura rubrisoli]TDD83200.1 hypothetical protein E1298_21630 [Actinomadura rubrisoli]
MTIARWVAETEAQKTAAEAQLREARGRRSPHLTPEEIADLVQRVDDLRAVIPDADPMEKEKLYEQLGLKMVYRPEREEVRVEINFNPDPDGYRGVTGGVRGAIATICTCPPPPRSATSTASPWGISHTIVRCSDG